MQQAGGDQGEGIAVHAPLVGWLWPLDKTPDPAFAQGALGPGVAIDPLDRQLRAPFAGTITTLNASGHAVVVRHASGIEVLIHLGIDTVALGGAGFAPLVHEGERVSQGQVLIECDLDAIAQAGKSLVTPVVAVSPPEARIISLANEGPVAAGDLLFRVLAEPERKAAPATAAALQRKLTVGLPHGIHARPAAALVRLVRESGASGEIVAGESHADLASVVALMRCEIEHGAAVTVILRGGNETLLGKVCALLEGDFAEAEPHGAQPQPARSTARAGTLAGLTGSGGIALGPLFRHRPLQFAPSEQGLGAAFEQAALTAALAATARELGEAGEGALGQVLEAHRELLADPEISALARAGIERGQSAACAWTQASHDLAAGFAAAGGRLGERAADLADLSRRVLLQLGESAAPLAVPPAGAIVLADDLLPSDLAHYLHAGIAGAALAGSSPTAHVAIIAAGAGLPLLTGLGETLAGLNEGGEAVLDADSGVLDPAPTIAALKAARAAIAARSGSAELARAAAQGPAATRDGVAIAVVANLGGGEDEARAAVAQGAEGCGLLRTEFLFLDRDSAPGEDEQLAAYRAVLVGLQGRPLTLRTLDIGGDKPVRFLAQPHEDNPALGLRGVRLSLAHPELFAAQLHAVLRAAEESTAPLELMVPMIASIEEWRAVKAALAAARESLGSTAPLRLGTMIETPAAALIAAQLAAEADFFSIGTNDLTQYILGIDRTNRALAAGADPLHPAVLRAIALTCEGAAAQDCPVSVCGGLAGDPLAVPLLIGLGVRKLSAVPAAIPRIKQAVRQTDGARWQGLAAEVLRLASASEVRTFLTKHQSTEEPLA